MEDKELLEMFIVEAKEHLENANNIMLELEQNPDDKDKINELFRAMHTIKGSAGFLGLVEIQELAHKMETVLDKCRNGELRFEGDIPDLMFKGIDMLTEMVDKLEAGEEEWQLDVSEVVEALVAIAEEASGQKDEKEKVEKERDEEKEDKKEEKKSKRGRRKKKKEQQLQQQEEVQAQSQSQVQVPEELLKQIAEEYERQVQLLQEEMKAKKEKKKEREEKEEKGEGEEEEKVREQIYLIFEVGDIKYLLPATKVLEVTELLRTTVVPDTPTFVEGVANLRGSIITVFNTEVFFEKPDMRINTAKTVKKEKDQGSGESEDQSLDGDIFSGNVEFADDDRKMIVLETNAYGVIGVIVDRVLVVKRISDNEFVQYPGVRGREFFRRIYQDDSGVVIELDFEEMLRIKTEREWKKGKKERRV